MKRRGKVTSVPAPEASPFGPCVDDYAHNLLVGTSLRRLDEAGLRRIESVEPVLRMVCATTARVAGRGAKIGDFTREDLRRRLRAYLRGCRNQTRPPGPADSRVADNLGVIGNLLDLDEHQRAVFQFILALHDSREIKEIVETFGAVSAVRAASLIAAATTISNDHVMRALDRAGGLLASGLVEIDAKGSYSLEGKVTLKPGVLDECLAPGLDRDRLISRFLPPAGVSQLGWDDFEHMRVPGRTARDLLAGTLQSRRPGVNVLFYGETGTGKTELAKLLARDIGTTLYVAGRADESGESAHAWERLSSLLLGERLLRDGTSLLLFDEMEDLFTWEFHGTHPRGVPSMSKQWFNNLLENTPVPTIWITNLVEGIDRAFLRRFSYAVEFRPIGPRQRARVLNRHLGEQGRIPPSDVEQMAQKFTVSPAQLRSAVESARLIAGTAPPDRETIEHVLAPMQKIVTGEDPEKRPVFDATAYRIDALNSVEDLGRIADQLTRWEPSRGAGVSMCLYGPPGTGKSEYAKYLAHRMGRPILYRHASDILGPFWGQTEAMIAEAFRRATDEDSLLLFDEADSFLRDRRSVMHSWETIQVNEFLQQLESFRGVVVCTTNLWHNIDEAALRRFIFKAEFRYLRLEQGVALFRSSFSPYLDRPPSEDDVGMVCSALAGIGNLAPGDFAAVSRRWRAMGNRSTARELVQALVSEARAKPGAAGPIGF
ncbi:MAG: ATP-binding protein [Nitrospirae bacterium]|nr:ATP-binding protein [Nitrospirota bacterium]